MQDVDGRRIAHKCTERPKPLSHCAADRVQALADSLDALLNAVADVLADTLETLPDCSDALLPCAQDPQCSRRRGDEAHDDEHLNHQGAGRE